MKFNYTTELINSAYSYNEYRKRVDQIMADPNKPETYAKYESYAKNNISLMSKYDDLYKVSNELREPLKTAKPATWLVISEGWCGDAAFNNPLFAKVEKEFPDKVKLKFVFRDENLDLMDAHLTNGGRSIPKLIVLNEDLEELGSWGPRPELLQQQMEEWKAEGLELKQIIPKVQVWYDADKTQALQTELISLVKSYSK